MIRDNFIVALKSDLSKLSAELVEVGIDQILEHDLWKDIPVVSSMVSIFRVGMNIKERIFFKKLLIFLNAIKEIPLEDRVNFLSKFKEEKVKEPVRPLKSGVPTLKSAVLIVFRQFTELCGNLSDPTAASPTPKIGPATSVANFHACGGYCKSPYIGQRLHMPPQRWQTP